MSEDHSTIICGMRIPSFAPLDGRNEESETVPSDEIKETTDVLNNISVNEKTVLSTITHTPCKTIMPDAYPVITERSMRSALKFCINTEMGEAYLALLDRAKAESFKKVGIPDDLFMRVAQNETIFVDIRTSENIHISDIETSLLSDIFGIFYVNLNEQICTLDAEDAKRAVDNFCLDIHLPDLIHYMGYSKNTNQEQIERILELLKKFRDIVGVIKEPGVNKDYFDAYWLINIDSIKWSNNTIQIRSPYISMLIWKLHAKQILRQRSYGSKMCLPKVISFQDNRLASQRDKRAIEIVSYVVALVESTGRHGTPHCKASTILCNCPCLLWSLEKASSTSHKNRILKRSFTNAWKYLEKYTNLASKGKAIIPSSDEYPTLKTLDRIFEFRRFNDKS
jgi:hypothetical protein